MSQRITLHDDEIAILIEAADTLIGLRVCEEKDVPPSLISAAHRLRVAREREYQRWNTCPTGARAE